MKQQIDGVAERKLTVLWRAWILREGREDERWDSLSYCGLQPGQHCPGAPPVKRVASHTLSSAAAHSITAGYLGQRCERHLTHCLCKEHARQINAGPTHIRARKHPSSPLDINPPFMLRLMPAPPGLTGRHARLRIWQQIRGTDGLSVQHHLPCFFQPRRCQDQARTHLAQYIQWERRFPSSHYVTANGWALREF